MNHIADTVRHGEKAPTSYAHGLPPKKPVTKAPAHACDAHAHVFGPGMKYPFLPNRVYTPSDALPADYGHLHEVLGIERGVLVQPSVYGTNNDAMLDAIALDPDNRRGLAVVPFDISTAGIESLHKRGVRGIRLNVVDLSSGKGALDMNALRRFAQTIAPFGWHVEFLTHVQDHPQLDLEFGDFPTPVCFGHLGYVLPMSRGPADAGFQALLRLMRDGKAWVKLTAPYRLSSLPAPYADVDVIAAALIEAAPQRLVWGSDWPHVEPFPGGPTGKFGRPDRPAPNGGDLFDLLAHWVPDEAMRKKILVDNPASLYDFPPDA